jgi:hypothetical protein
MKGSEHKKGVILTSLESILYRDPFAVSLARFRDGNRIDAKIQAS